MIISIRLKNFFSIREEAAIDFTADPSIKRHSNLSENLIEFSGDKFVNIIAMFGSNAAGKSNIIKALDFCRNLVLNSHLNNEGTKFKFEPFKFASDNPSEFYIDFVTEGIEYEYSFEIYQNRIISESLYYYPNKRKAKIFEREKTFSYSHRKGTIHRPTEVEANTGAQTLFLSRASSMNRPIPQAVYRFFMQEMIVGVGGIEFSELPYKDIEANKDVILLALEISDSDIVDIKVDETIPGKPQLISFHRENPLLPFNFEKEESDGTKRLLMLLLILLKQTVQKTSIFIDELDLKLHLRLTEFLLDVVRASRGAQLVFTSHNPSIINKEKLRRDQIVFVNKMPDGNSEFIPLSDFTGLGEDVDIQKAYLQGRFDAVPYIGDVYSVLNQFLNKP